MNLDVIDQKLSEMKVCVIDKENKYSIIRDRIDVINKLTDQGNTLKCIHKVFVDNGFDIAMNSFKVYVTRARKEQKKARNFSGGV